MSWLFAITLAALGCSAMFAQEYDLFVLCGQSNMDGRGAKAQLPKELAGAQENVRFFYSNPPLSTNGWVALAPGNAVPPGYKGTLPSNHFGPEVSFGFQIAKALPQRSVAIIKVSKGGTSLAKDWNPGTKDKPETQGPMFKALVNGLKDASDALKKSGDTYVFKGIAWHQGESDAALSTEEYKAKLTEFIGRVREHLQLPKLPFVIGEVFDNGKRDSVRAAQLEVSKTVPHAGFVPSSGLATADQGTHFDAPSVVKLGERFADEMLKQIQDKPPK